MIFSFIFVLCTLSCAQMVQKSNFTGYYKEINVPYEYGRTWLPESKQETIIIIPNFVQVPQNITKHDICRDLEVDLETLPLEIWNKTSTNPCETYFCSGGPISNNSDIHIGLHRYCTQCVATIAQNFTFTLSKRNCSAFERDYCKGFCLETSTCIYYKKNQPLCYHWDIDYYYGRDDYLHMHLAYFTTVTRLYILLPICTIIYLFTLFSFIVPELVYCVKFIRANAITKCSERFKVIFGLRSQIRIYAFIMTFSWIWANLFDIIIYNTSTDPRLSNLFSALIITLQVGLIFLCFTSIITLWSHIVDIVDSGDPSAPLSRKNL